MNSNIQLSNNESDSGFLREFVEESVEKPRDGLNGECIVHYTGKHSNCEMIVTLVNGIREGEALIVNDGAPYLRLEYEHGSLTGIVERMSYYGIVELRGHLVNGMESGLFLEYNENDEVMWMGYYKNGQRYSEVHYRLVKKDHSQKDGSGEYYELDKNGKVVQLCLYVNGFKSRVIAHYNEDAMTEYDENEKRVYDGGFKGDIEHGFKREGKGKEFLNGSRVAVYVGDWKNGKRDGLGTEYKGFKPVYTGGWRDGKRNGVGKEMDGSGNVVRSGVWVDGEYYVTVVIPSSLLSNPSSIEELKIGSDSYNDGSVTELKLSGLIRLKQIVIGCMCFGNVKVFELDGLGELESIVIGWKSFGVGFIILIDGVCRIVNCPKLKSIQIGNVSFDSTTSFELNNLPSLQYIDIGENCFKYASSFSLTGLIDWLT